MCGKFRLYEWMNIIDKMWYIMQDRTTPKGGKTLMNSQRVIREAHICLSSKN